MSYSAPASPGATLQPEEQIALWMMRYRWWFVVGVFLLGMLLTIFLLLILANREDRLLHSLVLHDASVIRDEIQRRIEQHLDALNATAAFYASSKEVEREEFQTYVSNLRRKTLHIKAMMYAPHVAEKERSVFEKRLGQYSNNSKAIWQLTDKGGKPAPIKHRKEYYPVEFAEPEADNSFFLGYDLSSDSKFHEKMVQALKNKSTEAILGPISFSPNSNKSPGKAILVFIPLLQSFKSAKENPREKPVQGYLVEWILVKDMLANLHLDRGRGNLKIFLFNSNQDKTKDELFYSAGAEDKGLSPQTTISYLVHLQPNTVEEEIQFAGLRWRILCVPDPGAYEYDPFITKGLVLLGGFIITALTAGLLGVFLGRHARIHQLVAERTSELQTSNNQLQEAILEQKKIRTVLEESEERLGLALKSSEVGTWDWRVGENQIIWDDYIHPIFGLEAGTFPGTYESFLDLIHPEDRRPLQDHIQKVLDTETEFNTEFRVIWPNGSEHIVGARGKVYRDEKGNPVRMTGVNYDLTDQRRGEEHLRRLARELALSNQQLKRTQENLRDKEERLALALKSSGVGTWDWNVRKNLILSDDNLGPLFGLEPGKFPPRLEDFLVLIHPEDKERVQKDVQQSLDEKKEYDTEYRVLWPDGSLHVIGARGKVYCDYHGVPLRMTGVCWDLTERKQGEENYRRLAMELTRSNKELEQFAYICSHDLQEPLRKVQTFGEIVLEKYLSVIDVEGQDYLQRMKSSCKRMQTLINDLLSFSRITTKARPFVLVDLNQVVTEVLSDLEGRLLDCQGTVEVEELPEINADPMQMRQLFQNLIGNGLKYHRDDVLPHVIIKGATLYPRDDESFPRSSAGECCEILVIDNGIGFEEKYLDRIFAPFQRLHGRGRYEGTGMGLAICRKIVDRHGGVLTARSTPGAGSTFIVRLPIHQSSGDNSDGERETTGTHSDGG